MHKNQIFSHLTWLLCGALLSGCHGEVTSDNAHTQTVEVVSIPEGAACEMVQNGKAIATITTPANVKVTLGGNLYANCSKAGYQNASETNKLSNKNVSWWGGEDEAYDTPMRITLQPLSANMASAPATASDSVVNSSASSLGTTNDQQQATGVAQQATSAISNTVFGAVEGATKEAVEANIAPNPAISTATEVSATTNAANNNSSNSNQTEIKGMAGDFGLNTDASSGSENIVDQFKSVNGMSGGDFFQLPETILDTK